MNKPIRLFYSENYVQKPLVIEALISKALKQAVKEINLYPGGVVFQDVIDMLAKDLAVPHECIILGHGIDGLLNLIARAYPSKTTVWGTFKPTYFVFDLHIERSKGVTIPVHYEKPINFKEAKKQILKTDVFLLASPNKQTPGYILTMEQIEDVLGQYKGLLVVDECYFGFGQKTMMHLAGKHPNLLVLRSVSKAEGLVGLRFAFGIGHSDIIAKLKYVQDDVELDFMNTFSLHIFAALYPHFPKLWACSRKFFDDFYGQLCTHFPEHSVIKAPTTEFFMKLRPTDAKVFEVVRRMNEAGYLFTPKTPVDTRREGILFFPGLIGLTPPPLEFWGDYFRHLKKAIVKG
jgi:Aminotransferase class I and II